MADIDDPHSSAVSIVEATVFTTPVILVISLGAYVFVLVVFLIIKEILVSKGKGKGFFSVVSLYLSITAGYLVIIGSLLLLFS